MQGRSPQVGGYSALCRYPWNTSRDCFTPLFTPLFNLSTSRFLLSLPVSCFLQGILCEKILKFWRPSYICESIFTSFSSHDGLSRCSAPKLTGTWKNISPRAFSPRGLDFVCSVVEFSLLSMDRMHGCIRCVGAWVRGCGHEMIFDSLTFSFVISSSPSPLPSLLLIWEE